MSARTRVLLVTHEASRTGAPRVAVQITEMLARRPDLRVTVIQRWGGPLEEEFRATGATVRSEPLRRTRVVLRRWRRTRRLAVLLETAVAAVVVAALRPSVVYANTCLSAPYLRPGVRRGARVVLHVHELASRSVPVLARYDLDSVWEAIEVIACSEAAAAGVEPVVGAARVRVVWSVPDAAEVRRLAGVGDDPSLLAPRGGAGAPPRGARSDAVARGARMVAGCGTPDVGKGADRFGEVARIVGDRADAPVDFVWIGADAAPGVIPASAPVRFAGQLANPYPALSSATLLAVTSREDAFPLVVLEAMALGTPVVAFDVGGIREQVGEAGRLVPPGDVDAFATAVLELLADPGEAARLGREGAARVDERFAFGDFQRAVLAAVVGPSTAPTIAALAPFLDKVAARAGMERSEIPVVELGPDDPVGAAAAPVAVRAGSSGARARPDTGTPFAGTVRREPFSSEVVGSVAIGGLLAEPPTPAPSSFRVHAIVPTFNESEILASTIEYLDRNGVAVYVLDNWSTDDSREIAESYLGRGVVQVERFPADGPSGTYDWTRILQRTEEITAELGGWCIQHDADERRESPWGPAVSLRDALWRVEQAGFNAIDHAQIDFHPVDDGFTRGDDPLTYFRYFDTPIVARDLAHCQAWLQPAERVDLATTGGHEVRFDGRKVFPYDFLLRHYGIRSQRHGERKILRERQERWNRDERRRGWHFGYDHIRPGYVFLRDPSELIEFTPSFYEDYVVERLSGLVRATPPQPPAKRIAVRLLRATGLLRAAVTVQRQVRARLGRNVATGRTH